MSIRSSLPEGKADSCMAIDYDYQTRAKLLM